MGYPVVELIDDGLLEPTEALARDRTALSEGAPKVRVARLSSTALCLGVAQPNSAASARRARALGIPVLRRSTGGTSVLLGEGDIVWSIVLARDDPRVRRGFTRAYGRFGDGLVRALASFGVESRWSDALGLSEEFCFLGGRGCALLSNDRVLGGAAQHLTRSAVLHHGVAPLTLDRRRIEAVFGLAPAVSEPKLTSLVELVPTVNPISFAARLADMIGDGLANWPEPPDPS